MTKTTIIAGSVGALAGSALTFVGGMIYKSVKNRPAKEAKETKEEK